MADSTKTGGTIYEDGRLEQRLKNLDKASDGTSQVGLEMRQQTEAVEGGEPAGLRFAVFDHIAHKSPIMSVGERMQEFVREVQLADSLDFDYYFTAEHHFSQDFSLSPSQPVTSAIMAMSSQRIRFGPMTVILPICDPLRIAEEYAIIDHLSGGRLEFGVGRGVVAHELMTYGRHQDDGVALFRENLEFIIKAWTTREHFSWNGRHHQYFDIEMPYYPLQEPTPRFWIPTATPDNALEWGRRGYGVAGFSWLGLDLHKEIFAAYKEGWKESGLPESEQRIGYLSSYVVAETDEEAEALAKQHFVEQVRLFDYEEGRSWWFGDTQMKRVYSGLLQLFDRIKDVDGFSGPARMIVHGSPETMVEKLQVLRDLGVNTFFGEFNFGLMPWDVVERSMRLFNDEVRPAMKADELALSAS